MKLFLFFLYKYYYTSYISSTRLDIHYQLLDCMIINIINKNETISLLDINIIYYKS